MCPLISNLTILKKRLGIGESTYNVEILTDKRLRFNDKGSWAQKNTFYVVYDYSLTDLPDNRIVTFDSLKNACFYIVETARERFGDIVDLNKIYNTPNAHRPVIDLNDLERRLSLK